MKYSDTNPPTALRDVIQTAAMITPEQADAIVDALKHYPVSGATPRMMSPEDVAIPFRAKLAYEYQEQFWVILLNMRGEQIGQEMVSKGSAISTEADPRDVFRPAITSGASAIILVHNHPSGSPEPSEADLMLTKRLMQAGELIGVRVLDHIVIGKDGHVSLRGRRQM